MQFFLNGKDDLASAAGKAVLCWSPKASDDPTLHVSPHLEWKKPRMTLAWQYEGPIYPKKNKEYYELMIKN